MRTYTQVEDTIWCYLIFYKLSFKQECTLPIVVLNKQF